MNREDQPVEHFAAAAGAGLDTATRAGQWDASRSSLAAWAALAAIIVPAFVAVRALIRTQRTRRPGYDGRMAATRHGSADTDITPPHGDKLMPRHQ